MAALSKNKLLLESENWQMLGISSNLADYQLVFHLNKYAGFSFQRLPDFEVQTKKKMKALFALFRQQDEHQLWHLIPNKAYEVNESTPMTQNLLFQAEASVYLLPKNNQITYWLVWDEEGIPAANVQTLLKKVPGIQMSILHQGKEKSLCSYFSLFR